MCADVGRQTACNGVGPVRRRVWIAVVVAAAVAVWPSRLVARLPVPLERAIASFVKLSAGDLATLRAGQPVTKLLDADPSKEVAVFGAVWVAGSRARYLDAVRNIEEFEKGANFRITKKISSPPQLADFAAMDLPDDDVAALRTCRVGNCELKLSEAAIARLRREIDWSRPTARAEAEALARQLAFDYVTGYLEGGNVRLATYRDSARPTFVADEFASMIDRIPPLTAQLPDLRRYLLEFPKVTLPQSESFLYWQEAQFGLKPTIRINHVVIAEQPTHSAIASKMLYASHYFWTALELRVLVPDETRGEGFWFLSVNRSRSDGLSGFVGRLIRGRVRSEAEAGMKAVLRATQNVAAGRSPIQDEDAR